MFEERIASLENGTGAVATASGMAAQLVTFMTLLRPGDEIVASLTFVWRNVHSIRAYLQKAVDQSNVLSTSVILKNWERAITPKTKALYGETIGNPAGSIFDFEGVSALAKANEIPLIIDNTLATPYLCRPLDIGADIVVHSATKFLNGHGNSIAGVIVDSGRFDFSNYPTLHNTIDTVSQSQFLRDIRSLRIPHEGACRNSS